MAISPMTSWGAAWLPIWIKKPNFNGDTTRLAKASTKKKCGPVAELDDETTTEFCEPASWLEKDKGKHRLRAVRRCAGPAV